MFNNTENLAKSPMENGKPEKAPDSMLANPEV